MVALELPVLGHAPIKRWGLSPLLASRWAGSDFDQSREAEWHGVTSKAARKWLCSWDPQLGACAAVLGGSPGDGHGTMCGHSVPLSLALKLPQPRHPT